MIRTYRDLIEYAKDCLDPAFLDWRMKDYLFELLDLPDSDQVASALDRLDFGMFTEKRLVDKTFDAGPGREDSFYICSLLYFDDDPFPFALCTITNLNTGNSHRVFCDFTWRKAKAYVEDLILGTRQSSSFVPLDAEIEEDSGIYPWRFLPKEFRPDYYVAKANFKLSSSPKEFRLEGFGLSRQKALDDLCSQVKDYEGHFLGEIPIELVEWTD